MANKEVLLDRQWYSATHTRYFSDSNDKIALS